MANIEELLVEIEQRQTERLDAVQEKLHKIHLSTTAANIGLETLHTRLDEHIASDEVILPSIDKRLAWLEGLVKWGSGFVAAISIMAATVWKFFGGN